MAKKSKAHLDFIRGLPCAVCGNPHETEAAHVRMSNIKFAKVQAGIGAKPDDRWTVPLCSYHHREQHSTGERDFWKWACVDPCVLALALWGATGDHEAGQIILREQRS